MILNRTIKPQLLTDSTLYRPLLDILYPQTCLGCNNMLQTGEKILCTKCRHDLPLTNHHKTPENDASKRLSGRVALEKVMSMLIFEKQGIVQQIIHKLKYDGHQEVGTLLGLWYGEIIKAELKNVDEIIPVPLHKRRLKKRGYNQVMTFCEALSKALEVPVNKEILWRNKYSKTQTKKAFFLRTDVNKEIFDVNFSERDSGKHFLLVDDVLTSGTTLEQCAKALLKIPTTKISIVTMALTY